MKIVLGGPGCGKTTALIQEVMDLLKAGVHPTEIGFVSFTRKAAEEATSRAQSELNLSEDDMPFFRTLHSLAFKIGGFAPDQLMTPEHWDEYADWMKIKIYGTDAATGMVHTEERGLQAHALARLMCRPLDDMCKELRVETTRAEYYARHLQKFKDSKEVYDYTDLLERFVESAHTPRLNTLIVDEAQDLSALQWRMVEKLAESSGELIVAGDDDQAIYEWAGGDTAHFLALQGERVVLPRSYRMARKIHELVRAITGYIPNRFEKDFTYNREGGEVSRVGNMHELDFNTNSWLIMCRNRYQLTGPKEYLRENGYPYIYGSQSSIDNDHCRALLGWEALRKGRNVSADIAWVVAQNVSRHLTQRDGRLVRFDPTRDYNLEDMNDALGILDQPNWMEAIVMPESEQRYYRAIKRRGESLIETPRITLSTIHAQKGGEADHVALFTDMSAKSYEQYARNPEQEARVFYVGASRAREKLFIFDPITHANFKIPEAAI